MIIIDKTTWRADGPHGTASRTVGMNNNRHEWGFELTQNFTTCKGVVASLHAAYFLWRMKLTPNTDRFTSINYYSASALTSLSYTMSLLPPFFFLSSQLHKNSKETKSSMFLEWKASGKHNPHPDGVWEFVAAFIARSSFTGQIGTSYYPQLWIMPEAPLEQLTWQSSPNCPLLFSLWLLHLSHNSWVVLFENSKDSGGLSHPCVRILEVVRMFRAYWFIR